MTVTAGHFSNAEVTWIIKNISLAAENTIIHSPPLIIHEPIETKWELSLRLSNDKIVIYLELLQTKSSTKTIRLSWASYISDGNSKKSLTKERCHWFQPNCKLPVQIFDFKSADEKLRKSSVNELTLKCHMLFLCGWNPVFPESRLEGVASLSNDLSILPRGYLHHDVIAEVRNDEFSLNKAMLSRQSGKIFELIRDPSTNKKVNLHLYDSKTAEALLTYLYTGNLSLILSRPSLTIYNCIKSLGIDELKNVYPESKIIIESKIDVEEHTSVWNIENFKEVQNTLAGPEFTQAVTISRWQYRLFPKNSIKPREQPKDSVYIEIALVESEISLNVVLEFSAVTKDAKLVHLGKVQGRVDLGASLGVTLFEKDSLEMERCLVENALLLKCTVRIATGDNISLITKNHYSPQEYFSSEQSFLALSKRMELLMKFHDFSDFSIEVEDHVFKTHKFLLAARSPVFHELLSKKENSVSMRILSCKKDTFGVFLKYLYTGVAAENDSSILSELYDLGDRYKIHSLKRVCASLMPNSLCEDNFSEILEWADDRKEDKVKTAASYLLQDMYEIVDR